MVLLHHPNLALPLRETIPITLLSRSPFDGSSFPTIPDKTTGHPGRSCKGHGNLKLSSGHGSHYTSLTLSFIASANGSAPFYGISPPVSSSYNTTYPCLDIDPDLCPSGEPIEVSVSEDGNVTPDSVKLLFIAGQYGSQPHPLKQLVAYQTLFHIAPGRATHRPQLESHARKSSEIRWIRKCSFAS